MAQILKKTAKKPPKVKKTYQNTLGSEKMWFNVLKNVARDRAYQSFIRSFIHYDRVSLRPEHIEVADRPEGAEIRWYTPNRAWYWEFVKENPGSMTESTLKTTIKEHEPYLFFVENAAMEEYPDNWKVFRYGIRQNARTIRETFEKIFESKGVVEEEEETYFPVKKKLIRKIKNDWNYFMDSINSFILGHLRNAGFTPRDRRLLQTDIDPALQYKEVRDYIDRGPGLGTENFPLATINAISSIYARNLQRKNPDIVWENFINFVAHFKEEYMQHIYYMANNQDYTEEDAVLDVTYEQMRNLARNIWRNNPNDVETLMRQLPNYS